ncbi:branched-chain amino acid transport system II carrier protein [Arcobacter cryaerophilus gv. pseudocryaerophilus]
MKTSNITRDTLILGFAIFSMYFGAGNIIFPPYLGLISSSDWKISFFAYFLADIGFATFAMFALLKVGGNVDNLTSKLGDNKRKNTYGNNYFMYWSINCTSKNRSCNL